MTYTQSEMDVVEDALAAIYKVINRQRDDAVILWEFGKTLAELSAKGLPTVLGEEAALAKKMNLRHFNSAQEVRCALPVPKNCFGGIPSNDYYIALEDWLGIAQVEQMRKVLALIQKEIEPICAECSC